MWAEEKGQRVPWVPSYLDFMSYALFPVQKKGTINRPWPICYFYSSDAQYFMLFLFLFKNTSLIN